MHQTTASRFMPGVNAPEFTACVATTQPPPPPPLDPPPPSSLELELELLLLVGTTKLSPA